ncbi:MAG: 1-phosphofructokinase [Oscillospiraceae bacterium]|nr:1-phosphofructokinase [Oscillospiraceae bacterium]
MIYTVTLNPALDKTAVLPDFIPGQVNRIQSVRVDAGGKGINVSKCLKALGEDSLAVLLAAGQAGHQLIALLAEEGIATLPVWVEGETRTNLKLIDPVRGENTDINEPGPRIAPQPLAQLLDKMLQRVMPGDIAVLSGSLPAGARSDTYAVWVDALTRKGVKVFLDADAEAMARGMDAVPYLIKPNETELSRVLGRELKTPEALLAAGKELQSRGIAKVVISMGGAGALFLLEGGIYQADSLSVPVKSTVGAGDSMVAAMAFAESRGLSEQQTIRLAMAMGAASVMQDGSQAPREDLVRKLKEQVIFRKWQ